ncbi:hypothetical protein [Neobacillus sp. 19]|uniref:hypothetical protein n=1 Tax=Neobacillus sp. 19 TaxID=3394458 RepID=UPI003BF70E52
MKKWIREYEQEKKDSPEQPSQQDAMKIGQLVRSILKSLVKGHSLSDEQVLLLQDVRYCKSTFDINYALLKKVAVGSTPSQQRKINGYDRYWEEDIHINGEQYFVCNDWYERNRAKFIRWCSNFNQ